MRSFSVNQPNEQKLISGRYLGEIMRLVICELIDEGVLFLGQNTYKLESPYVFETAFLSLMERYVFFIYSHFLPPSIFPYLFVSRMSTDNLIYSDPTDELLMIIGIFSHFFAVETTLAERQFFRALAMLIGRRAARLSACGIAAIVSKMGYLDEGCLVGADGSLYNVCSQARFRCLIANDEHALNRNTLDLRIGYMRVLSIFSEIREGALWSQSCLMLYGVHCATVFVPGVL